MAALDVELNVWIHFRWRPQRRRHSVIFKGKQQEEETKFSELLLYLCFICVVYKRERLEPRAIFTCGPGRYLI